jgi:hypothetical protein
VLVGLLPSHPLRRSALAQAPSPPCAAAAGGGTALSGGPPFGFVSEEKECGSVGFEGTDCHCMPVRCPLLTEPLTE